MLGETEEIRNSNIETPAFAGAPARRTRLRAGGASRRQAKQIQNSNALIFKTFLLSNFIFWSFEIVSDFVFRN